MSNPILRLPFIQNALWQEWQKGYRVGFNARPVAEDIAKHYSLTTDEAVERIKATYPTRKETST